MRFAPSPTGPLHIGGVRTALYNYLFARQPRRQDDPPHRGYRLAALRPGCRRPTSSSRSNGAASISTRASAQGGPHAPYRQSERREIYLKYALQLVDAGWAYYAFDTAEELNALRARGRGTRRDLRLQRTRYANGSPRRSPCRPSEVRARIERGDQWVVRFKMPERRDGADARPDPRRRGGQHLDARRQGALQVGRRTAYLPSGQHRGRSPDGDHRTSSAARSGCRRCRCTTCSTGLSAGSATQPEFAHLPLLLKPTGGGKLSKRDGDKMGFPVFPLFWQSPDGRDGARLPRGRLLPRGVHQHAGAAGLEPGHGAGALLDAGADRRLLAGACHRNRARASSPTRPSGSTPSTCTARADAELAALYQPDPARSTASR